MEFDLSAYKIELDFDHILFGQQEQLHMITLNQMLHMTSTIHDKLEEETEPGMRSLQHVYGNVIPQQLCRLIQIMVYTTLVKDRVLM